MQADGAQREPAFAEAAPISALRRKSREMLGELSEQFHGPVKRSWCERKDDNFILRRNPDLARRLLFSSQSREAAGNRSENRH